MKQIAIVKQSSMRLVKFGIRLGMTKYDGLWIAAASRLLPIFWSSRLLRPPSVSFLIGLQRLAGQLSGTERSGRVRFHEFATSDTVCRFHAVRQIVS